MFEGQISFKDEIKEWMKSEMKPYLISQSFTYNSPRCYAREQNGLLQLIFFNYGEYYFRTSICMGAVFQGEISLIKQTGQYDHYTPIEFSDVFYVFHPRTEKKTFEELHDRVNSDWHGLFNIMKERYVPNLNELDSLRTFEEIYVSRGDILGQPLNHYHSEASMELAYKVLTSSGLERMRTLEQINDIWGVVNPKLVREYYEKVKGTYQTDEEAEAVYYEYCNRMRSAYKLPKQVYSKNSL